MSCAELTVTSWKHASRTSIPTAATELISVMKVPNCSCKGIILKAGPASWSWRLESGRSKGCKLQQLFPMRTLASWRWEVTTVCSNRVEYGKVLRQDVVTVDRTGVPQIILICEESSAQVMRFHDAERSRRNYCASVYRSIDHDSSFLVRLRMKSAHLPLSEVSRVALYIPRYILLRGTGIPASRSISSLATRIQTNVRNSCGQEQPVETHVISWCSDCNAGSNEI